MSTPFGGPPEGEELHLIEWWPIDRVQRYAKHARKNRAAVSAVATSIDTFRWRRPLVVDAEGVLIVGDAALQAAKRLKHKVVPVHVARGLSAEQARAYRLADNATGEHSVWDDEILAQEIRELTLEGFNPQLIGLSPDYLEKLLAIPSGLLPTADPDDVPPLPVTPRTKPGDVYQLGAHRLVCGDSKDPAVWAALMGEERAQAVFTDPPYGVKVVGGTKDRLTIQNDDLPIDQLTVFLRETLGPTLAHCQPGAPWYVCAPHGPQFLSFAVVGVEQGWWRQTLVWAKDTFSLGRSDYHYRHEAILTSQPPTDDDTPPREHVAIGYGWAPGAAHTWRGGRKQDTVWDVPKPRANDEHPTMKPVELIARALQNSTIAGDLVLDPFGGSGSTLITCEMLGRRARLIELDPRYCDVIVRRWEEATGMSKEDLRAVQ